MRMNVSFLQILNLAFEVYQSKDTLFGMDKKTKIVLSYKKKLYLAKIR